MASRIGEEISHLSSAVLGCALLLAAGCKDSAWTAMGSAELVLSEIELGGVPSVAKRIDSDEKFGQSVMKGIATGDSLWLDVAGKLTPASAAAEASMEIALAAALPHSPDRVLSLLRRKYPLEQVCGIPFLGTQADAVVSYHDSAASAVEGVSDTLLIRSRDACLATLDSARDRKLKRIAPSYIVKNKPAAPSPRRRK